MQRYFEANGKACLNENEENISAGIGFVLSQAEMIISNWLNCDMHSHFSTNIPPSPDVLAIENKIDENKLDLFTLFKKEILKLWWKPWL